MSEYELPVPQERQSEIGYTYRAPDFAFGSDERILLLELKTEWRSYKRAQISDFLRLARRLHPDVHIDLILLEERLRGARFELDARQRYAEVAWSEVVQLIRRELPGDDDAARLCDFLDASLPGDPGWADREVMTGTQTPETTGDMATELSGSLADRITTSVDQALHIAPAIEADPTNRKLARGVDVPFASETEARAAEAAIREALSHARHTGVSTWLWRRASGGVPATPAGGAMGIELRLQPRA